jgi:hypothetical protein
MLRGTSACFRQRQIADLLFRFLGRLVVCTTVYSYARVMLDLMFWAWLLTDLGGCLRLGLGCISRWILSTRVELGGDPGLVPCASLYFCVFLMISDMNRECIVREFEYMLR